MFAHDTFMYDDPISINGFSLSINSENGVRKISKNDSDYFILPNESEYSIVLKNNKNVACDAYVYVDGNNVGTFRIKPYTKVKIERPAHAENKFTFVSEYGSIARSTGASIKADNGLIKVIFKPAKVLYPNFDWLHYDDCDEACEKTFMACNLGNCDGRNEIFRTNQKSYGMANDTISNSINDISMGTRELKNGLTVLGDTSFQKFSSAEPIPEYDTTNITEINTRILCEPKHQRPHYRPLSNTNIYHSNRVPPKINNMWNQSDIKIEEHSLYR